MNTVAMPMQSRRARSFIRRIALSAMAADGTGKMGPTLVGKDVVYPQALTDPGMFSIIYGGASGAMQSFARRGMQQDPMLKIIAYVRSLDK
jgi:cytochrome c-L